MQTLNMVNAAKADQYQLGEAATKEKEEETENEQSKEHEQPTGSQEG